MLVYHHHGELPAMRNRYDVKTVDAFTTPIPVRSRPLLVKSPKSAGFACAIVCMRIVPNSVHDASTVRRGCGEIALSAA